MSDSRRLKALRKRARLHSMNVSAETCDAGLRPPVTFRSEGETILRDSQQVRTDRTRTVRHPGNPRVR